VFNLFGIFNNRKFKTINAKLNLVLDCLAYITHKEKLMSKQVDDLAAEVAEASVLLKTLTEKANKADEVQAKLAADEVRIAELEAQLKEAQGDDARVAELTAELDAILAAATPVVPVVATEPTV
jgi:septal ring factor EnvC (AmiA/AmiB activator)